MGKLVTLITKHHKMTTFLANSSLLKCFLSAAAVCSSDNGVFLRIKKSLGGDIEGRARISRQLHT
jgi:hypothetical protein